MVINRFSSGYQEIWGFPKSWGYPKMMVYSMENRIEMDDDWGYYFFDGWPYIIFTHVPWPWHSVGVPFKGNKKQPELVGIPGFPVSSFPILGAFCWDLLINSMQRMTFFPSEFDTMDIYIYIYIYIYIWVNYNDLTVLPHWNSWLIREIIPKWPNNSG